MESQFEQERLKEHINVLKKRNVDGIVAFGFSGCEPEVFNGFKDKMVLLSTSHQDLTSVIYNGYGAISLVLSHLKERELKRISYVGVNVDDMTTGHDRLQAYLDFCETENVTPHYSTGELSFQSGYEQTASILNENTQAIVCATDTLALVWQRNYINRGEQMYLLPVLAVMIYSHLCSQRQSVSILVIHRQEKVLPTFY